MTLRTVVLLLLAAPALAACGTGLLPHSTPGDGQFSDANYLGARPVVMTASEIPRCQTPSAWMGEKFVCP
jgi:hypothetical protein